MNKKQLHLRAVAYAKTRARDYFRGEIGGPILADVIAHAVKHGYRMARAEMRTDITIHYGDSLVDTRHIRHTLLGPIR